MIITIDEGKGAKTNISNASLQNIGESSVTTDSKKLPVFYVIIGCGTAAVVNHTILRQTEWGKNRIAGLPVMHIGFNDPWDEYFEHGMGQPPYLLTMPGYHQRPVQAEDVFTHNPGCSSKKFANCTKHEWDLLWNKYHKEDEATSNFHHKKGWVAVVQKKSEPMSEKVKTVIENLKKNEEIDLTKAEIDNELKKDFPSPEADYRLVVLVPEAENKCRLEFVYAKKIDICTGAGRAQIRFERGFENAKANKIGKTMLCIPPALWSDTTKNRRIVTGPEALMTATVWNATDRVYVNGGGGIGLNMVERGEGEKCYIDWASRSLLASFNLPRNDTVLRHATKHHNVNTAEKTNLKDYLNGELKNETAAEKVASWLIENRNFDSKKTLKTRLSSNGEFLRRHESLGGSREGYGAYYSNIADSLEMLDVLNPGRNSSLAGRRMNAGDSDVREGPFLAATNESAVTTPSDEKWRFGKGCDLDIVKIEAAKVTVKIKPSTRGGIGIPEIRDYFENNTRHNDKGAFPLSAQYAEKWEAIAQLDESSGGVYQRVCVTTGLGGTELGEPTSTAADFRLVALIENGRTVGLQADSGNLRVLGAAAQVHPNGLFVLDAARTSDPTSLYFNSLPMSAVPPGFIFTGINIADANHYFDETHPNTNVNTMTLDEVLEWVHKKMEEKSPEFQLPINLALKIVKHRRFNNGYEDISAIEKFLQDDDTYDSIKNNAETYADWKKIIAEIQTNYPVARELMEP